MCIRDSCDHALRTNETVDTLRETLMMTLQISLSLSATRQNEATKKLAGWGALLAIPTMVFSIYGMNFKLMPELNWPYGYPVLTVSYTHLDVYKRQRSGWWIDSEWSPPLMFQTVNRLPHWRTSDV